MSYKPVEQTLQDRPNEGNGHRAIKESASNIGSARNSKNWRVQFPVHKLEWILAVMLFWSQFFGTV